MSEINSVNQEDVKYELWEEMKQYDLSRLHAELLSPEEMRRFAAAQQLHLRGDNRTFEYVVSLSKAQDASYRDVATFTLGQLGTPNRPFRKQSIPILSNLLRYDPISQVRAGAAAALGHLSALESFEYLNDASKDKDADVRASVAFALGTIKDEKAIQPLIKLTHDDDSEVVSWAVVGLITLDMDSPIVRDRFVEMLNDTREEILDDVIIGLSKWKTL
jgi:HEAT repeat protein